MFPNARIDLMDSFLMALLLALAGFLFLSFCYNLPPKAILYKIIGRFLKPPEVLRPVPPESPYRRSQPVPGTSHQPILLNLATSDGSGQAVHPDVVYIPGGFGEKKWPYWMVCTPYPNGNELLENPEIFVSYDGIVWSTPDGVRNPLVAAPRRAGSHHSDPDILFHDNMLWIIYRQTIRSDSARENVLYLIQSGNGHSWSVPVEILRDNQGAELLSPALIHDGTCFMLWTIENHSGKFQPVRRTSRDCLVWDGPRAGTVSGLANGRHPWHIDVLQEEGRLSAALVSCTGKSGQGSRLHYAYSLDQGLHWQSRAFLLDSVYEFESSLQYRATLRRLDQGAGGYQLWYSAVSSRGVASIAYLPLIRKQNDLFPAADPGVRPDDEPASA